MIKIEFQTKSTTSKRLSDAVKSYSYTDGGNLVIAFDHQLIDLAVLDQQIGLGGYNIRITDDGVTTVLVARPFSLSNFENTTQLFYEILARCEI